MATYDAADFGSRIRALLPQSWFSTAAQTSTGNSNTNGVLLAVTQGLGNGFAAVYTQLQYALAQTRLATATDTSLDAASLEMFNGVLPRGTQSDAAFSTAIRQQVIAPLGTLAAVTSAVNAYFAANPDGSTSVLVFDRQSDPVRSGKYGLKPGQIAIVEYYGNSANLPAWYQGQSFIGQSTYVAAPYAYTSSLTPTYPNLGARVNAAKAAGAVPVYIVSSGDAP